MTRTPPHDLQVERNLLGAMLTGSTPIVAALPLVSASDFYSPAHAAVFDAIVSLHSRGEMPDPGAVANYLRATGELESVGGHGTLLDIMQATPATSAAATHARIIANLRAARRLIGVADQLADLGYRGGDIADALDEGRAMLNEIDMPSVDLPDSLISVDDFLDRPKSAKAAWVIPGLLRTDWRCLLVAGEGVGKTMITQSLAMMGSQGIHPFALTPMPKITSLIIDLENPDDRIELGCSMIRSRALQGEYERDRTYLWPHRQGLNLRTRADRALADRVLAHVRPDIVVIGPLNKLFQKGRDTDEQAAAETQEVLDDLRIRHGFALVIEHHAPKGQSGVRDMVPFGSQRWQSWPELGIGLVAEGEYGDVKLTRFRGDRLPSQWPMLLERGGKGNFPWRGVWPPGVDIRTDLGEF